MFVTRAFAFRAVHALDTGQLREGRHGHRYVVEITLERREDEALARVVRDQVLPQLHGRTLEVVKPSTGERLVEWIDERLRESPLGALVRAVVLHETAKNRFVSARSEERYV